MNGNDKHFVHLVARCAALAAFACANATLSVAAPAKTASTRAPAITTTAA